MFDLCLFSFFIFVWILVVYFRVDSWCGFSLYILVIILGVDSCVDSRCLFLCVDFCFLFSCVDSCCLFSLFILVVYSRVDSRVDFVFSDKFTIKYFLRFFIRLFCAVLFSISQRILYTPMATSHANLPRHSLCNFPGIYAISLKREMSGISRSESHITSAYVHYDQAILV